MMYSWRFHFYPNNHWFFFPDIEMYYDNSTGNIISKDNKSGSRSKYIDIKYLAIREHVKKKESDHWTH